jgi:hypothetical protein
MREDKAGHGNDVIAGKKINLDRKARACPACSGSCCPSMAWKPRIDGERLAEHARHGGTAGRAHRRPRVQFGTGSTADPDAAANPGIKLFDFSQAEAYTRRLPFLTHVVLPRGIVDLGQNIPRRITT